MARPRKQHPDQLVRELEAIRGLSWRRTTEFEEAVPGLLADPHIARLARSSDSAARIDALKRTLISVTKGIERVEKREPPDLERSDALTANALLRLLPRFESKKVDELQAAIAQRWLRPNGRPVTPDGFRKHLQDGFYVRFAAALRSHLQKKAGEDGAETEDPASDGVAVGGDGLGEGTSVAAALFVEGYVLNSPDFQAAIATCDSLSLLGYSHNRMVVTYSAEMSKLVEAGGILRVLAIDPADQAVLDANERSFAPKKPDAVRHQHEAAVAALSAIGERSASPGAFEIRLMDVQPPFTIYLFDEDDEERARAFVWLTPWRVPSRQRPGFQVSAAKDGEWYYFFADQFHLLWKHFGGER